MNNCKTCVHWVKPDDVTQYRGHDLCVPLDSDTYKPMDVEYEIRVCKNPLQGFCEAPASRDGFSLADGSGYDAVMATAEGFGCVLHEPAVPPVARVKQPGRLTVTADQIGIRFFGLEATTDIDESTSNVLAITAMRWARERLEAEIDKLEARPIQEVWKAMIDIKQGARDEQ